MLTVYPDYYKEFKCIASECRHNCCIGWEIDIDPDTFEFYNSVKGDFGQRLKNNIENADTPHFVLGEKECCPFLNSRNLCDIIITLGEENICDICKEHPRFHNELPDRTESGLGLCCEEAARLILGKKDPVRLIYEGEEAERDEIIELRDKVIALLQNRSKPINTRITESYDCLGITPNEFDLPKWADTLLKLERLDEKWTDILILLKTNVLSADFDGFKRIMENRQTEYEQLLVYIIFRYFADSFDLEEAGIIIRLADLLYRLIFAIGAVIFTLKGEFTFGDQTEIVRMLSSEIEYSDENLGIIYREIVI